MKKIILTLILFIAPTLESSASICKKEFQISISMDSEWHKKEQMRLAKEEILLSQYSQYISKHHRPLIREGYSCKKGEICDVIKNCQMEKKVKDLEEIEYVMNIDSGITIIKSHCSMIGKCIGYNDFTHSSKVTAAEDRLIDIKKDNALFYHYFFSARSKNYEPLFNMTNFHTGHEIYFDDIPHFSPDEKILIEVRSVPKREDGSDFPSGFNINIYEANEVGEYHNVEPAEIDAQDSKKILSTFLSRNPACGETPHFHSWKSDREVVLSMQPPSERNGGKKVILFYDKKAQKWNCKDDISYETKCESYLPTSTKFSSNLTAEQIANSCH